MTASAPAQRGHCWAVVPAAGRGQRLGGGRPKQYLPLDERTIAEHTLDCLLDLPDIALVMVALAPEDDYWHSLPQARSSRVETVAGGADRAASVLNALTRLKQRAAPGDWVLVHDMVRPCTPPQCIQTLREELADHPVGGLLAIPVTDSLHRADSAHNLLPEAVSRDNLWRAQTPQLFRYGLLCEALQAVQDAGETAEDEAAAMLRAGHRPRVVQGSARNIKITVPEDLPLARSALAAAGSTRP